MLNLQLDNSILSNTGAGGNIRHCSLPQGNGSREPQSAQVTQLTMTRILNRKKLRMENITHGSGLLFLLVSEAPKP